MIVPGDYRVDITAWTQTEDRFAKTLLSQSVRHLSRPIGGDKRTGGAAPVDRHGMAAMAEEHGQRRTGQRSNAQHVQVPIDWAGRAHPVEAERLYLPMSTAEACRLKLPLGIERHGHAVAR